MNHAKQFVTRFRKDDSGQNLVEYALVVVLVALAAITAMSNLGTSLSSAFSNITSRLTKATPAT